jgi:hypothetical protein
VMTLPFMSSPAGAWCYSIGSHASAVLDWEWNGSDIKITRTMKPYGGGTHSVWDGYARRLSADLRAGT